MKKILYAFVSVLFLASCAQDEIEQGVPQMGELTQFSFTLSDGNSTNQILSKAVAGETTNPLSNPDIIKYIKHIRLLVFNSSNKLVHDDAWTTTTGNYETAFTATTNTSYDFVIITNTDISNSFTTPLLRGVSEKSSIIAMLKEISPKGTAAGNGDFGNRYQQFTRSGDQADINHVFYGVTSKVVTVGTNNTIDIPIKRIIAMVNFTVDIKNPAFQPAMPDAAAFTSALTLDVSRMARGLNMEMRQTLQSASGYNDCVVRSGAFLRNGTTEYKYKTTAFVMGNNKKAFLTFSVKTQKAVGGLAIDKTRLFWMDVSKIIERNKIYNITATIQADNFGGDPTLPGTVNPEDPDPKLCNLIVNVTASDWETTLDETGNMH